MVLYQKEIETPVCTITIICTDDHIINLYFQKDNSFRLVNRYLQDAEIAGENALCGRCAVELAEYFAGSRKSFDLPIKLYGTNYQTAVWDALQKIPYGTTTTYAKITAEVAQGSARSAGGALGKNPVPILLPCHRVTGSNGSLGGFCNGFALTDIKRKLLLLEGAVVAGTL